MALKHSISEQHRSGSACVDVQVDPDACWSLKVDFNIKRLMIIYVHLSGYSSYLELRMYKKCLYMHV